MSAPHLRDVAERRASEAIERLRAFASIESPTDRPEAVARMQDRLAAEFEARGFRIRHIHRPGAGPHLLARRPGSYPQGRQLVLGHADTVWPEGTLARMPVRVEEGRLHGPGTFDMKAGLAGLFTALDILDEVGISLPLEPVVLVNADEETGSPTSKELVVRVSRTVRRCWVLEPPRGPNGALKTVRNGVLRVRVTVHGEAAHAGLDPGTGASAIAEAGHVVHALHALQDVERGISVNVGRIEGGTRPNVVAARATLECDARTPTLADAEALIDRIHALRPTVPGTRHEIDARVEIPPLEPSPRNRALWARAVEAGRSVGVELEEVRVGGASDGNTAAAWTAVLDGLGWVGDGAHADHEHVVLDRVGERVALLAALLASPLE